MQLENEHIRVSLVVLPRTVLVKLMVLQKE